MHDDIRRIREKLKKSGKTLNPPVPEECVLAFEAKHRVRLPEQYRAFLTELGDGGDGPYYGIQTLAESEVASERMFFGGAPSDYLSRSCQLVPEMVTRGKWVEKLGITRQERFEGTFFFCNQGCTYACLLIVSGAARGRIVYVDFESQAPRFTSDMGFLEWYERWLDVVLMEGERKWLGLQSGGPFPLLNRAMKEGTADERREAIQTIGGLLSHHDSAWRATALANVGGHRLRDFLPRVLDALSDPDWAPRRGALCALADLSAESGEWIVHAREQLQDPAPEVREAALKLLTSRHALTIPDLIPLRYDPDYDVRCEAIRQLGRFSSPEAMPLLEPLLQDPDSDIRSEVALSIGMTQHPEAARVLATALEDISIYVRSQAAFALGMTRAPAALSDAIPALLRRRHAENNTGVRDWVDGSLQEVLPFVVPQFTNLAVGDSSLLRHPEPLVRQAAVLNQHDVPSDIICLLLTDPDLDVRIAALHAVAGPFFSEKWEHDSQQRLFRLLDDPKSIIRSYAVKAIRERCDSRAARALFEERAATESDPHVRQEMLRAIDAIDSQGESVI